MVFFILPEKSNHLLCLCIGVGVETQFPLIYTRIYFGEITVHIACWQIHIISFRKKGNINSEEPDTYCDSV